MIPQPETSLIGHVQACFPSPMPGDSSSYTNCRLLLLGDFERPGEPMF